MTSDQPNLTLRKEQGRLLPTSSKAKSASLRRKSLSILSHIFYDTWTPELLTLCLSILSLTTIGIVVSVYNDHAAPTLPTGIGLNAVVSILATISKSALIFTVATCISQLKWPWYHVPRSLNDLQILEDASRGPLGSVFLLTRTLFSTASLGALITLLALATDPFLQQLIAYPVKQIYMDSSSAQMRRATLFGVKSSVDPFSAAINAGIWSQPPMLNPTCPTGNCTWSEYTSVAWCNKCEDQTQSAVLENCGLEEILSQFDADNDKTVDIPCQIKLASGRVMKTPIRVSSRNGGVYSLTSSQWIVAPLSTLPSPNPQPSDSDGNMYIIPDYLNTNDTYLGIKNPVISLGYAAFDLGPGDSVYTALPFNISTVQECVVDLCFANYAPTVTKGQPTVKAIRTQPAAQFQKTLPVQWLLYASKPNATYHCWRRPDVSEAELTLKSIFNSTYVEGTCGMWVDTRGRAFCLEVGDTACPEFVWAQEITKRLAFNVLHEYVFDPNNKTDSTAPTSDLVTRIFGYGLENITSNIAASLTNLAWTQPLTSATWIEADAGEEPDPDILESLDIVYGQAGTSTVTFVKARFQWLVLPVLLEVATGVLLTLTIMSTKKKAGPLWKGSVLALLAHGLREDSGEVFAAGSGMMTVPEIEERAEKIKVCLKMTEKGYGFAHNSVIEQQRNVPSVSATTSDPDP